MFKPAIISFIIVASIYAFLAAFTKIFYTNKPVENLSHLERNVLYDRASVGDRATLFITNLFSSFISPPVYILAIVLAVIIYLAM